MGKPQWRIFYADGSTFDSNMGEPHVAPPEGFVCAVGYDETGTRYIMHGWDFYQWDQEGSQWWGMDRYGLHDRLRRNLVYAYKEGRTVKTATYKMLMTTADQDPDFPRGRR